MLDRSYAAVMSRKNEIMKKAIGNRFGMAYFGDLCMNIEASS